MPSCKDLYNQAEEFLEGKTGYRTRFAFLIHLLVCVHCRRYLKQFRLVIKTSQHILRPKTPDDDMIKQILDRVSTSERVSSD